MRIFYLCSKAQARSRGQLLLPMYYSQYYVIKLKTVKILYYIKLA